MLAALAVAPQAAPDPGLAAALIVAAGVTAIVALGSMLVALHRRSRLTVLRGAAAGILALGVVGVAAVGVLAVSPVSAQASPDRAAYVVIDDGADDATDIQLPTLSTD